MQTKKKAGPQKRNVKLKQIIIIDNNDINSMSSYSYSCSSVYTNL